MSKIIEAKAADRNVGSRVDAGTAAEVNELVLEHSNVLDTDDLESWPTLFLADAQYIVLSRENVELGLVAPLVYYYSRGMLQDRVTALRDALTYEFVYTRHVTSVPFVRLRDDGDLHVKTSFSIYQSTEEGVSRLFAVGEYSDVMTRIDGVLRFKKRVVVVDSFGILNNIAIPL